MVLAGVEGVGTHSLIFLFHYTAIIAQLAALPNEPNGAERCVTDHFHEEQLAAAAQEETQVDTIPHPCLFKQKRDLEI